MAIRTIESQVEVFFMTPLRYVLYWMTGAAKLVFRWKVCPSGATLRTSLEGGSVAVNPAAGRIRTNPLGIGAVSTSKIPKSNFRGQSIILVTGRGEFAGFYMALRAIVSICEQ
jgi:hypothetical protein